MAGAIPFPPATMHRAAFSACRFRTIAMRPQFRPILLTVTSCSRASTSWTARSAGNCGPRGISDFVERGWSLQPRAGKAAFSTAVVRRKEEGTKKDVDGRVEGKGEQTPPSPLSGKPPPLLNLKSTLKTIRVHENIYTIPNILTLSRLIATPIIGYLIVTNAHFYAFSLFLYAAISDFVDGWIARKWNLQTVVGSVVDPMADKALMTTLVTCLAVNGSLSLPIAVLILGRDVSLATAALYYRYASLPAPKTMGRYWDFSLPSAEVHPTTVSKLNTFLQLVLLGTTMCVSLLLDPTAMHSAAGTYLASVQESLGGQEGVDRMVKGMSGIVAATTVWSGLSYAFMKDAVKILGENEDLKKKQGARGRMIVGGCFGSVIAVAAWLAVREWNRKEEEEELSEEK